MQGKSSRTKPILLTPKGIVVRGSSGELVIRDRLVARAVALIREGATLVPDGETRLRAGDQIVVVTTPKEREATERRLRALSRQGRLAVWRGDEGDEDE